MSTAMLLASRFNGPTVPLEVIAQEFFGLEPKIAARYAAACTLPVAAARMSTSRMAPWLVHVDDLAKHMDAQFAAARRAHANSSTQPREQRA